MKGSFYKKVLLCLISVLVLVGCKAENLNDSVNISNKSTTIKFLNSVKFKGNRDKDNYFRMNNNIEKLKEEKSIDEEEKLKRICLISKKEEYIVEFYDDLYGYALENAEIKEGYSEKSKTLVNIDQYEKVQILKKYTNNYYYIKFINSEEEIEGYIQTTKLEKLPAKYIEVDISNQSLNLYTDNKLFLETNVVTGLDSDINRKTPYGYYEIYVKQRYVTLKGKDYESDVAFWMPFYLGYGIHDASWRSEFGGEIYKTRGSHGCVNMPSEKAKILFNEVDLGTKVLVHK